MSKDRKNERNTQKYKSIFAYLHKGKFIQLFPRKLNISFIFVKVVIKIMQTWNFLNKSARVMSKWNDLPE